MSPDNAGELVTELSDTTTPRFTRPQAVVAVLIWLVLAVVLAVVIQEPLAEAEDGTEMYLPLRYESQTAQHHLRKLFPTQFRYSSAVIVFHRPDGLTLDDFNVSIKDLVAWIKAPTLPESMSAGQAELVRTYLADAPVDSAIDSPGKALRLNSDDTTTTLVLVGMPDIFTAKRTQACVKAIREKIESMDLADLKFEITGDAGFFANYNDATQQSVDRSTLVTVILVVIILLVVYRSPVAMLVPLVTIGLAVHVAMRVLYLLAPLGFEATSVIEMFVVVIVFGSGTDYCLFVIARYKEEVATPGGRLLGQSMHRAWRGTAAAIAASAMTTIIGLSLMCLAEFRAFAKAGPSVAVALGVGCLASLTLAPSLCLLAGRALFWLSPKADHDTHRAEHFWARVARVVTAHPLLVTVLVVAVLAGPSFLALDAHPTHNIFDELSEEWSSVRGFELLRTRYAPGTMGPATLLIEADQPLDDGDGWDLLARLVERLRDIKSADGTEMVAEILHPGLPVGFGGPRYETLDDVDDPEDFKALMRFFYADKARAARLVILMGEGPYTDNSVAAANEIRRVAKEVVADVPWVRGVQLSGASSTIADVTAVARHDFRVTTAAVLIAVYVILLIVLRRPILGLFLIGGTVLSFMTALGLADLIFVGGFGEPGLDWKIKFFLLVILVAVGVDYNIYVCTRIRQEMKTRPLEEAVRVAVSRTGGIISACGVIVAGTFASMIAGNLSLMIQLGFALAVGILVDTFLVRPLMVPAVALMLSRLGRKVARGFRR
jgi:putative drug exporter of the RND superfamily